MKPSPRRAPLRIDPDAAAAQRRLGCARERACLDVAVRAGWPGMTCVSCASFETPDGEAIRGDVDALTVLAGCILGRRTHRGMVSRGL